MRILISIILAFAFACLTANVVAAAKYGAWSSTAFLGMASDAKVAILPLVAALMFPLAYDIVAVAAFLTKRTEEARLLFKSRALGKMIAGAAGALSVGLLIDNI
jgi:hypothetical protein